MSKKDIIQLKPNASVPCLKIWCGACDTVVKVCKKNGKTLSQCVHVDDLQYRAVVYRPGTKTRVVRSLGKSFNSAIEQLSILKQQIEKGSDELPAIAPELVKVKPVPPAVTQAAAKPESLLHVFARYIAWLENEGVAGHLVRNRSASHKRDVRNCFRKVVEALKNSHCKVESMRFTEVDDHAIGAFHDYLNAKGVAPRTYNKFFSYLSTFADWADAEGYGDIKRCISRVHRKSVAVNPETITSREFETLISVITPENGYQYGVGKRNEKKIIFKDYLVSGFRYSALTGRRGEEVAESRWNHIFTDEQGNPKIIRFNDYKVARILHIENPEDRPLFTPVTDELARFLHAEGFAKYKDTDQYIIAPELTHNRIAAMRQALSRGFSHYWKVAFPNAEKQLTFKCLRKTYLTNLSLYKSGSVRQVSGHASDQILRHYIDPKQAALTESLKNFTVLEANPAPKKAKKLSKKKRNELSR